MFALIIPWITLNKKRASLWDYIQITRWQQNLDRQRWGCQKEGWWVAPCTRGATETKTCLSFPLSQSPLLPKLVWVPDMKISQPCIFNRQICSAVFAGSLFPLFQTEEDWWWQKTSVHQSPSLFQPKGRLLFLLPLPSCEPLLLPRSLFSFYDPVCPSGEQWCNRK